MTKFVVYLAMLLCLSASAFAQPVCNPSVPNADQCLDAAKTLQPTDIVRGTQSQGPARANQTVKIPLNSIAGFVINSPAFARAVQGISPTLLPPTPTALGGVKQPTQTTHQWINGIDVTGEPILSQPVYSDISNIASGLAVGEFWANAYGNCTWDATHDVYPCILLAQSAAIAAGAGLVRVPEGVFGLASTIYSRVSGVKIKGIGKGRPADNRVGYFPITVLKWIGASGSDMIAIGPTPDPVNGAIVVDAGVTDLMLDGNSLAATGIHASSVRDSTIDITLRNMTTACILLDTAHIGEQNDTQGNTISDFCNNQSTDGDNIQGNGTSGSGGTQAGNISINSFPFLTSILRNGWGVHLTYSDNNQFGIVDTFHLGTTASFTGSVTGNNLNVTVATPGTIVNNMFLYGISFLPGTKVVTQVDGTTGGVGDYTISGPSQTVASNPITAAIGGGVLLDSTANGTDFNGGNNFGYLNTNGGAILINGSRSLNNNFYHLDVSNATPTPQYGNGAAAQQNFLNVMANGAITVDIPDNQATGGQIRGANSIDLQHVRPAYPYVAQGPFSQILGGENNRAGAARCWIWAGQWNECGGAESWVIGQFINAGGRSGAITYGSPGALNAIHIVQTGLLTFANSVAGGAGRIRLVADTFSPTANNTAALLRDLTSGTMSCDLQVQSQTTQDAAYFTMSGANAALLTRGTGPTSVVMFGGNWTAGPASSGAIGKLTPTTVVDNTLGSFDIGVTATSGSWYAYASCRLFEN